MVDEGHIVGNHTMHHPDMSKLTDITAFQKELEELEALFQETTGKQMPKYYRPPQGIYSQENLQMAQQLGYQTVFWSLAYADWNNNAQPTAQQAFDKLLPRVGVSPRWKKFRKNCFVFRHPLLAKLHDLFHTEKVCFTDLVKGER